MRLRLLHIILAIVCGSPMLLHAQDTSVYHTNGSAYTENCNCYTLTNEERFQAGSVWNKHKIDLSQSFDFKFNVFLGCRVVGGADGIVFVLQAISTSIGSAGEGMGFSGIVPSIGVTIDTYQNGNQHDPWYDHIAIQRNGDVDHASSNNLAGPVQAVSGSDNIKDCQWHTLRIMWNASSHLLKAQIDGVDRVQVTLNLVKDLFRGDPMVFWGFTAATGGSYNRQRFCTSLNPGFSIPSEENTCFPATIQLKDSSFSFGSILKWYWDFGDGTKDSVQNPPIHHYASPGKYEVKLNIMGNNGCVSDTLRHTIVMGSKPKADFSVTPFPLCLGSPAIFHDASSVQFGTINNWTWNIDHGSTLVISDRAGLEKTFTRGPHSIDLMVKTKEGCVSDTVTRNLDVLPRPEISLQGPQVACTGMPVAFVGHAADATTGVAIWKWRWGDGSGQDGPEEAVHSYVGGGKFPITLNALGINGCPATPVSASLQVYATHAFAGRDTVAAMGQPIQLNGSGGELYSWSPATGLSNPNIANPVATLQRDASYVLRAFTLAGCSSTDTIHIKIYRGPNIYVPSAFTPNNDGRNDRFRFVAAGMQSITYFSVYNRYGQLVYSSVNPGGWDGTFNGKTQDAGVYVWMIKGKDYLGADHVYKGTVVLVR